METNIVRLGQGSNRVCLPPMFQMYPLPFVRSHMEPDFENVIQQAMTQTHNATGSPLLHPGCIRAHHSLPGSSLLKKSAKRKFFMMINSNWWDLGRFKFSSPLLIFSNSIMYFPWNKGSTCHAYFCDNHSPVFHSMFVIYL